MPTRCVLGRSRACSIRLDDPEVSGEHATLRWVDGVWELQDLHSRNGTFVDGRRIDAGSRVKLAVETALGFGQPDGYVLIDAGSPRAHAVRLADPPGAIAAQDGLLVLPDAEEPELSVFHGGREWLLEGVSELRPVSDGEVVQTRAGPFRLHLPEPLAETRELSVPTIATTSLRFAIYGDDEYVELLVGHGERTTNLKARSHHRVLLALARVRLEDRSWPPAERGWIHQDDLLRSLGMDAGALHVDIHRLRRQLAEIGIADAAGVIERVPGTRLLRIGVAALEIESLERR